MGEDDILDSVTALMTTVFVEQHLAKPVGLLILHHVGSRPSQWNTSIWQSGPNPVKMFTTFEPIKRLKISLVNMPTLILTRWAFSGHSGKNVKFKKNLFVGIKEEKNQQ